MKLISTFIFCFFLYHLSISQCNPYASYPIHGNANDASGNGHDGTIYGALLTSDRFGNSNEAFYFDSARYITLPTTTLGNWTALTFSMWVYAYPYNGSRWPAFFGSSESNTTLNINLGIWQNTDNLHIEVSTNTGNYFSPGKLSIPWNAWFHAAMVFDGDSLIEYINGKRGKAIVATGTLSSMNEMYLGKYWSENVAAKFKLDDIQIFPCALSDNDIKQLANPPVTAVTSSITQSKINFYPNPTTSTIYFNSSNGIKTLVKSVEIYNSIGEKILIDNNCSSVDVSQLAKGLYQIIYKINENEYFTDSFIKN